MKTHLDNSQERKHYIVNKSSLPELKLQTLYTGTYKTHNVEKENFHQHNFYEIMLVTEGAGTIYIDNHSHTVSRGNLILYRPKQKHCEVSARETPLVCYFFAIKGNSTLASIISSAELPEILSCHSDYDNFFSLFQMLISESKSKDCRFSDEIANCLCETIVLKILHLSSSENIPSKVNETVQMIINYIDNHYCESFYFQDIYKKMYINKYYASRVFKEHIGTTPAHYLIQKRIARAKELLKETELSVEDISNAVGYSDVYHFSRIFKENCGVSPQAYRSNSKGDPTDISV